MRITRFLPALAILATPAFSQVQFAVLEKRHLPTGIDRAEAVEMGDVDGDGDLDLVFGLYGRQNRLCLNDGPGWFTDATAARMPTDGDFTLAAALGDVDGDGDLDLVFGNIGQDRLYLNDGTGRFTDATAARMPTDNDYTRAAVLGDVDGDGDLDLVLGNSGQNRLYLNSGAGAFTDGTGAHMPTDSDDTSSAALGDVDGDGDLDLVFGTNCYLTASQNRLYLNDGKGQFTDATAAGMPTDRDYTTAVALGDVDGDGDLDLVFGNRNSSCASDPQNRLYLNDGTGTFSDATGAHMPTDRDDTTAVARGDVDGDGDLDLVFGNYKQQSRLYLNDGTGRFTDATARMPTDSDFTWAVAMGDVDGDRDLDLVFGGTFWSYRNRLYLNDGQGQFINTTVALIPFNRNWTRAEALGDVDGDGDLDLVFGNWVQEQNRLYLNDGTGTFTDATAGGMPTDRDYTTAVALGDVDGDGDLDLVFGGNDTYGNGRNRLYLNDGRGRFTDATAARMPAARAYTCYVALGDVDGDGDLDLVLANSLYLNDGQGQFTHATGALMPTPGEASYCVALGDVDSDGDLDLVFGNVTYGALQNRLYLNDGNGRFTDATAALMPADGDTTASVALGDVDGDSDLDLVFGNMRGYGSPQNRLYLNDGKGQFTDATAALMPADNDDTWAVAMGDVDGDGDLDLVLGNASLQGGQQNRLYLNDGKGQFGDATAALMPTVSDATRAVVLGDADGDGDVDLFFANIGLSRLYLNLARQLESLFLVIPGRDYRLAAYARHGAPRLVDVALPYVSAARAHIPLPPFGTLGLDPATMIALPPFVVPQPAGVGSTTVTIPMDPALVGRSLHAQVLLLQWPGPTFLTNVTSDRIVR